MLKDTHIWFPGYLINRIKRKRCKYPVEILFAIADHFEPRQKEDDPPEVQLERVKEWITRYEERYSKHRDSRGNPPAHTYFFPQEQYRSDLLEMLADHCSRGFGEVEVHIHHDNDTTQGFLSKIERFKEQLAGHRLLPRDSNDHKLKYGFVHGNWALDNSRRDGRWCGLNNEITLLARTGCYADFTLPSAPAPGQTRKINSIYLADDDPARPKSHNTGRDLRFGGRDSGDLLMIQGPLTLNWRNRRRFILPGIENSDINIKTPITPQRIKLWLRQQICVAGRENVIFVKVHCHGLKPRDFDFMLGEELERGFRTLENKFNDGDKFILHYVTARQMANIAMAFNHGIDAPVSELRDYRLKWPRPQGG